MRILLDTCVILWANGATGRLSRQARVVLEHEESEIYYSPLSCAEVALSVQRKRITLDRHWRTWFRHFVELNDWQEIPIDLEIIEEAYCLPEAFHADPMDRILVATARVHGLTLLTADKAILRYPHVRALW
jgi:PIN domain nuclease of toxin-antitoxin system